MEGGAACVYAVGIDGFNRQSTFAVCEKACCERCISTISTNMLTQLAPPLFMLKTYFTEAIMVTKVIDEVSFELKEDFDFSFLSQYGSVFTVFDKQDSGNLCFGVKDGDRKLFLKIAGTSTTKSRASK